MTEVSVQTDFEGKSKNFIVSEKGEDSNIEGIKLFKAYLRENINFMKVNDQISFHQFKELNIRITESLDGILQNTLNI